MGEVSVPDKALAASRKGILSVINRLRVRRTAAADPGLKANVDTALQLDTVTNSLDLETEVKDTSIDFSVDPVFFCGCATSCFARIFGS